MRTTDKSSREPDQTPRALIWDLPLRLFHWALASAFVVSWITAEAGIEWTDVHLYSGYTVCAHFPSLGLCRHALCARSNFNWRAFVRGLKPEPTVQIEFGHSASRSQWDYIDARQAASGLLYR